MRATVTGTSTVLAATQRECAFEAIFGEFAVGEHCPRIIDQDVDARFLAGDFGVANAGAIGA
jgi:hypothetical protein